ncbi:putative ribonuclease H-like domain-containing protein [Tanacetum coccineum]
MPTNLRKSLRTSPSTTMRAGMTQKNSSNQSREEKERNDNDDMATDGGINKTHTEMPIKEAEKETEAENGTKNKPIKRAKREKTAEASNSQPVGRPVYEAILRKKITRKEDIGGNFEIPCNIGGLKRMNALVDQGSDVNVMPLSTYMKLIDEMPKVSDGYVYPMDFVILDIREDEKRPFILGTPFLTTAKAVIKFDKGTITLRSGKSKISFHRIPKPFCKVEKGIKNDVEPIAPTMTVNSLRIRGKDKTSPRKKDGIRPMEEQKLQQ